MATDPKPAAPAKRKYAVNWTLRGLHNKVYEQGDTVELTEAEFKALNGSAVVTVVAEAKPAA